MHKFFIVTSGGLYGHFGKGYTLDKARNAWRNAGGTKREGAYTEWLFTSELPFAPMDKNATEQEADAWIGQDGSCNWIRCERTRLTPVPTENVVE